MKFLIDTNIVIPLEPTGPADLHVNTPSAAVLAQLAMYGGHQLYVHPAIRYDVARDRDDNRRELRTALVAKYLPLLDPPASTHVDSVLGEPARNSHDHVDHQLLAALYADAVDYLVTEDTDILRKARRLGIDQRVFTIGAATSLLRSLFDINPPPPPAVRDIRAYTLNPNDPIFTSFRADYDPDFDDWFARCRRQQRQTWVIDMDGRHAALAIVNEEKKADETFGGKTLKICSLKVSDAFRGFRFGELLLKTIFGFAETNAYASAFVTVLPKYVDLLDVLTDFGFVDSGRRTPRGEIILAKRFTPDPVVTNPIEYNVRFGPAAFFPDPQLAHLVPIQPRFSDVLFPETAPMQSLFPGRHAFGNGIRKAYLCNAPIRTLPDGAPLFFYRSDRERGIIAVGVLERFMVSRDADEIVREVGRRTVYRFAEIQELAARGEVLVLFFRQSRILIPYVDVRELEAASVINGPPQSIQRVREEGARWLYQRIAA
jgi:GNAT superfamily N-acetyltransferase